MDLEEEIYFKNIIDKQNEHTENFNSYINLAFIDNNFQEPTINDQQFTYWVNLRKFKNFKKPINNINSIPDFIDNPKRKTSKKID